MTNSPACSGEGRSGGEFCGFRLRGQIQGVGFRPFVYRLANEIGIAGTVCNDPGGVTIEAAGTAAQLAEFERRLRTDAPALARIDGLVRERRSGIAGGGVDGFVIIASDHEPAARGRVTVDAAVCADCLAEMFRAGDRRYRHGLINCTNCGPRYSIVRDLPYDRPLTTMAGFALCGDCAGEYADPGDRRFHAQPTCCVACGPQVELRDATGALIAGDPFVEAGQRLRAGLIVAMKGLGGYHLVADATAAGAVALLRARKRRSGGKPFAVMVGDYEEAARWGYFSTEAEAALRSAASPIVIVRRRRRAGEGAGLIVEGVAPGQEYLGLMLPNTPMQHLLLAERGGQPLVMTSANISDDPLLIDDEEAFVQLQGVADFWLRHDRPIERAVDDSIYLDFVGAGEGGAGGVIPIRRARGLVPMPVDLPFELRGAGCCLGADLKNTVALVRGREVVASQHLGDLTYARAYERFEKTLADLARLFEVVPEWVAVDLHPGYLSRQYGMRWAREAENITVIEVQHHHAHLAAVMAEHGRTARTIGLICDGVGYGVDGSAWGGEVLVGDLLGFERVGCLRGLRLPGGDAAAKQTGRCGLAWLADALGLEAARATALAERLIADAGERKFLWGMLARDLNCPLSTGMGRLFDAAAALLGFCTQNHYEAESGQLLESAALRAGRHLPAEGWLPLVAAERDAAVGSEGLGFEIDTRPMLRALVAQVEGTEVTPDESAWMFHDALAGALTESAVRVREGTGIDTVGISGGVFCNGLLTALTIGRLQECGFTVLRHRVFPPNDGGIAFGQAAIAGARLANGGCETGLNTEKNDVPCPAGED